MRSREVSALKATVGENVRRLRLEGDMTQAMLAAKAGMNRRSLAKIETGLQNLTISTLARLATALGCDVPALLQRPARGR